MKLYVGTKVVWPPSRKPVWAKEGFNLTPTSLMKCLLESMAKRVVCISSEGCTRSAELLGIW